MLAKEREQSMSRKEYLKRLKKNKMKFPLLKPILISVIMIALFVYVIHQLHVYNTVTEMANKVVEESKLIKTYKMYFMSKPYEKEQVDNILYLYTGADESRLEIKDGLGLSNIQVYGDYLYGIKEGNLVKINTNTYELKQVCEENVVAFSINNSGIFVYRYYKSDASKTGLYKIGETEELIINKTIHQLSVDDNYIYIVAKDSTEKTLLRYTLDGKSHKSLTEKITVSNIVLDDSYIYYTNNSDKNRIYKVRIDGSQNVAVTQNKCVIDASKYNGNSLFGIYQGNVIYINSEDNKIYLANTEKENVLIDNEVKCLQLNDKMLYVALKNKIEIHRYNLEKNELDKITSARFTEFIFVNN